MKTHAALALGLCTLAAAVALAVEPGNKAPFALKDQTDKFSYSIGRNIGLDFKKEGIEINARALVQGVVDALSDAKPLLTDDQIDEVMQAFRQELAAKQTDRTKGASTQNLKEGEAFLAENKKKKGVVVLPSGLQYKILKAGNGKKPKAVDTVTTHYRGTLIDGTEFDSSLGGDPMSFPVEGVISGWTEALQLMPVGSKWQLFIPAKLAYGERSPGGEIGPNSMLIFEIELLGIK